MLITSTHADMVIFYLEEYIFSKFKSNFINILKKSIKLELVVKNVL